MEHPAFAEAGQAEGLEIWTIDKFEPVPVERSKYGHFYNGDAYIVLKTTEKPSVSHSLHFWLGRDATQDKRGAAAFLAVALDEAPAVGGRATHHREVQGHESAAFLGYFKPAIRYLEGGLESGFREVEMNAGAERRLLRLSGCDNMRIETMPPESSSLTREHCFILEVDHDIFVLMPEGARATHRRKIIGIANRLRDEEHNGRATIDIIDEFSPDEDIERFFEALGSGSKDDLADALTPEVSAREGTAVFLYRVLDAEELELDALPKPFKQKNLSSNECYILDTPDNGIFLWLGSLADQQLRNNYHRLVQLYLDTRGYPSWVHATRVTEGAESSLFKQYFTNWDINDNSTLKAYASSIDAGYNSGEETEVHAKLVGKSAAASQYMPDDGAGDVILFRFASGEEDITEQERAGVTRLFHTEVYVLQYQIEDGYILYCWTGNKASQEDKTAAYEKIAQLEDELEGNVTVVRVPQGKEPKHFLAIFKGTLVILFGGKDNDYAPDNENHDYEETHIRLFRVEGTALGEDMRAAQLAESADSLEDDDVFVLETSDTVYVWRGKESAPEEQEAAMEFVKSVVKEEHSVVSVAQGDEPELFWEALGNVEEGRGGEPDAKEDNSGWRNTISRRLNADHLLTSVTLRRDGHLHFEQIPDYTQEDLSDDGVYILDTGEELYLWRGGTVPERLMSRGQTSHIIEQYLSDDGLERSAESTLVVEVRRGAEPAVFRRHFTEHSEWDPDMWENQSSYDDLKNKIKGGNS